MAFLISKSLVTGVLMELVGVGFDLSGRVSTLVLAVTPGVDNAVGGDTFS